VKGKIERIDDTTIKITELPLKVWTQNYKVFLESLVTGTSKSDPDIKDFKEDHTDTTVSFTIIATKEKIDSFERGKDGLNGKFKLTGKLHTTNMNLFDELGRIIKYQTPEDILSSFYGARLDFYGQRKDHLLMNMRRDLKILSNKARFVEEVCKEELVINNRKRKDLLTELQRRGYDLFDEKKNKDNEGSSSEDLSDDSASDAELARGYEYLLGMKIWNLTFEKVEQLRKKVKDKEAEVVELEATSPSRIWENDLDAIEEVLGERDDEFALAAEEERKAQKKSTAKRAKKQLKNKKAAKKKKKKKDEWDSDLEDDDSLDGRDVIHDSDGDNFVAKKAPKKTTARSRKTTKKVPDAVISKKTSKNSDVDSLSDEIKQRLTVSPQKKPSLLSSIDSFLSSTSPSKGIKRLSPSKESINEIDEIDDLEDSPVKKPVTKKKPAKRAKQSAKTSKSSKSNEDDEDVEIIDEPVEAPARAKRTTRGKAKKITYAVLEESDDSVEFIQDSDEESDFE